MSVFSYKSCGKIKNVLSFDRFLICIHKLLWILNSENDMISILKGLQKVFGDGGYRSPYLSHAKRALYHLSYVPMLVSTSSPVRLYPVLYELVSDLCPTLLPWQGWWRCAFQGQTYGPYTCADIGATVSTTCTLSASAATIG